MRVLNPEPSQVVVKRTLERLPQRFPALKDVKLAEAWAGMIDVTPDAVPYIAEDHRLPGLFLATGLSGHGFGIGPAVGRIMADLVRGRPALEFRRFLERLYMELYDVQYRLGKPSIAAVRGAARAGGMTVMLSCDMVVAGEGASFGYPEIDVGLVPGLHLVHLPRVAGRYRAFEPLFTGEPFDAATAMELGLLSRLVADEAVADTARGLAETLAAKPPEILRLGREAFMRANDLDYRRGFEQVAETMTVIAGSEDCQEGLAAFAEKRKPRWTGR